MASASTLDRTTIARALVWRRVPRFEVDGRRWDEVLVDCAAVPKAGDPVLVDRQIKGWRPGLGTATAGTPPVVVAIGASQACIRHNLARAGLLARTAPVVREDPP